MEAASWLPYKGIESWPVQKTGPAETGMILVPEEVGLEAEGGCDVTLGIGILYRGAFGCTTRILRNCSGRGRRRQDYLLCLPGSFSSVAGEPSLEPNLRWPHARLSIQSVTSG